MTTIANDYISSLTTQNSGAKTTGSQTMDQSSFLKLMSAQLKMQDPFQPMDNTQMVAQMATFSQVAGTAEMNVSLKHISSRLDAMANS
ncbi:MAG TPA: flagellar hook capping FlgD N-terminal domain-containing protein, partial [Rhizorhapis sp.]|nr:flagellar hook capping FlgD N-terminal domain-containing protein [Rhizorhapis sp.]